MTDRTKVVAVGLGALLLVAAGLLYVLWSSSRVDDDIAERELRAQQVVDDFEEAVGVATPTPRATAAAAQDATSTAEAEEASTAGTVVSSGLDVGEVLVIHRVPGEDYGRLAIRHLDGSRTLFDRRCVRVHIAAAKGVCLADDESVLAPSWRAVFFDIVDDRLVEYHEYASPLPSRVRVSPDGSNMSLTGFVSGSNYADIGGEAQTLVTIDGTHEPGTVVGLVQFDVASDEPGYGGADRQFWGVTWADSNEFWVTGHFGDGPEIMRGDMTTRLLTPTGWAGSCPSLAPDGRTLVFKELATDGDFELVAVDLVTGDRWKLGEDRSVDDQVEWLDDDTILYALHAPGTEGSDVDPQFDIWSLDITDGAEPELFLPAADSPGVVRAG